ncbi:hypothetical protein MML48_6g00000728 [Holotrichia oblita]|uniref:Uncharacterized protein n=1 Tax=Holotrichia oblita TaxID=644536 RepID=A0ACB9SZ06_HOLOL|nr:hypothetical protein MML48_6g00000728 [Holotrichia oblita]
MDTPKTAGSVRKRTLLEIVFECITVVVHILALGLTIFIIYLCFLDDSFNLRTWHVLLYTVGWTLLMTEGILTVVKENIFTKRLQQPTRVHIHWATLLLATELIIGGLGTIVWNRSRVIGSHFLTEHGISGILATVCAFVTVLNGVPALYSAQLRKIISPNINKLFHAFFGFVTVVAGAYATITGYYTGWFRNRSSDTVIIVCFIITLALTLWCMVRPLVNGFTRVRNLCN